MGMGMNWIRTATQVAMRVKRERLGQGSREERGESASRAMHDGEQEWRITANDRKTVKVAQYGLNGDSELTRKR